MTANCVNMTADSICVNMTADSICVNMTAGGECSSCVCLCESTPSVSI
jgi:hypothetical protein